MLYTRRTLLAVGAAFAVAAPLARAEDVRMGERSLGKPDAPVTVLEYFSLTCPHCARFARDVLPQVQKDLIDTGKVRMVFHEFPLNQVDLSAIAVARSLPPERYEPFVMALFASQDRWAFARGVNNTEELWKMAALAGMNRATFDAAIADEGLKHAILADAKAGEEKYHVDSTPTFVVNGKTHAGEVSFETFSKLVDDAAPG